MAYPYIIVAIEGIDACGKDTQCALLAKHLNGAVFNFPDYTTPAGKLILGNLKREWMAAAYLKTVDIEALHVNTSINAHVLQSLMLTNRMERSAELEAMARLKPVVLCRYAASAFVYGGLDGLDQGWLEHTNAALAVQPDVYVLVDIPVHESWKRRPERRDRYEADRGYLEKVRVAYLRLFTEKQEANAARARGDGKTRSAFVPGPSWIVVDGMGSVEEVHDRIVRSVQQ